MNRPKNKTGDVGVERTLSIGELSAGGDGVAIAEIDGERRAVFVRGAALGDEVRARVDARTRPARGRLLRVVKAGPERVEPACRWVGACGGCDWMHVSDAGRRAAHEAHARAALPRPWQGAPIAVHAAPSPLHYRTRARVHVRASGGRAIVGMNEAGTREPVEVERCVVLHPDLEAARAQLGALFEGAHGRGEVQIALGGLATSGPRPAVIELRWSDALPGACFARLERAVTDGWLAGARVTAGEARVPAKIGDPTPWMLGGDGLPLRLAPGGFGQASDEGNATLGRRVAALAQTATEGAQSPRIVELYAGAGNFTVLLAGLKRDAVVAVESARASCEAARANLEARGLTARAKVIEADAAAFAIPPQTTLVVLDPPRTGARDACARLPASSAKHVVYVSCDTRTLARDLELLAGVFEPRAVEVFELFPQTSHVEVAVALERRRP
jgi:23S rRNA (uracil1939-C5)-methyltransferase